MIEVVKLKVLCAASWCVERGIFDVDAKLIEISNEEEKTFALILEQSKGKEGIVKNLRNKKSGLKITIKQSK
jgi:hypothetical protein